MVNSWEDFVKLLEYNCDKFNFTVTKFWLDKEQGWYEEYIEVFKLGCCRLFINNENKEVCVVEYMGDRITPYELQIAFNCDYKRYIQIINAIFDIDLMEKNDVTC